MTEVSHWLAFVVHRLFSFSLCINSLFLKELAYIHTHTYMHIFKILNKRKPHTTMTNSNIIMTLANPFSLFHLSFTMGKKITERGRDLRRRNGQYYVWYCFFFFFFCRLGVQNLWFIFMNHDLVHFHESWLEPFCQ